MLAFLRTHPYLLANLPLLFLMILVAKTTLPRQHGRLSLLCGYACIPCALLALIHEKTYWTPVRLGGASLGVEDLVFAFVSGSLGWFLAGWPFRHRLTSAPRLAAFSARCLPSGVIFGGLCWLLWQLGLKGLDNTLAAGLAALVALALLRPRLLPLSATGVLLFVPVYLLIVTAQFHIWPDYVSQWNLTAYGGSTPLGVPAGEIAWAVVFSAVWPLMMGFFFDVQWAKGPETNREDLETSPPRGGPDPWVQKT